MNQVSRVLSDDVPAQTRTVKAWDVPTRLFKWTLVVLIVAAWISSSFADPTMTVHKATGYAILTLLVYRVLYGFCGASTARFSAFVRPPREVLAYFRALRANKAEPYLGHNPAGGAMIVLLLLACGVQALVGLFASDGVTASGPFADRIGDNLSAWAASIHATWFYAILGLAAVHIAVNLYYQFRKKDNVIGAMITGRKAVAPFADERAVRERSPLVALACLAVAAILVYASVALLGASFFASV